MNNFSEYQTLLLIEEGEKSHIEFKNTHPGEVILQELLTLMDYLEDHSLANVVVFHNLDCLNMSLSSVDQCKHCEKVFTRLNRLPTVTIAVIAGACRGISLQLAISCDFRLATDNSSFQSIEVKKGYIPGMITFHIAKFVGIGIAKRILFTGVPYQVEDAFQNGLVDLIFSVNEKKIAIDEFIEQLLPIQPFALQLTRRLLDESFANSYDETIGHFIAAQYRCMNLPPNAK